MHSLIQVIDLDVNNELDDDGRDFVGYFYNRDSTATFTLIRLGVRGKRR
jgi:hypothetical protein